MRIAVVSPGGVGGYFGGLLARAGEDVVALARGQHLAAIRKNGLRVEAPGSDFTISLKATDDASQLGVADVVVFAVKLFQIEAAAAAARPLFGSHTIGISLLNGIEGPEMISRVLPEAIILGGSALVSAGVVAPGHIRSTSALSTIVIGSPPIHTPAWERVNDFTERCKRAGFAADLSDNVRGVLWNKLIGLSANSALTAASRRPSGELYSDPDIFEVASALMAETSAIARAKDVQLPPGVEDEWLELFKSLPAPGIYASMYYDLSKGNPIEVDGLSGYIVREGKRLGVPTPHHAALYAVLKPYRNGTPAGF